ncbi:MerC domain-containing protein [Edaphobacter albus]|uniref:MerC domain-containing protein n=1 Tax=Edaphobacter sp. 4G125 TaxID=2763071 RepID=UPI001646E74F|nr:MerC domain-containing protein [Edaphobacter sp. 4G125]QNI36378.1 MerC domain-containing protein [Edaphobacter sp. 4G125]
MSYVLSSSQAHLRRHADLLGAVASGVCFLHCLITPLVISLFPSIIPYLPGDAWFHRLLAIGIVLLGAVAFIPGYRLHRRKALLLLIGISISFILIVAWSGESLNRATELYLSLPGSGMLVAAHPLNRSFCRQYLACKSSDTCHSTNVAP